MNRARTVPPRKARRILGVPGWKVPPKSTVCGKRRFTTYDIALKALLRRHCPYPLRVYKCPTCGGFHLTKRTTWEDR